MIDIMYITSKPVLNVVEESTKFSAARFLSSLSTKEIWEALLRCWVATYTGLPNRILVDQVRSFGKSEPLFYLSNSSNVAIEATGTEAH